MTHAGGTTVWVFGDQLHRELGAMRTATRAATTVLLVEATEQLAAHRYHRQRLHLVLTAMRRFAAELRAAGFRVDHRRSATPARQVLELLDSGEL
jgi:deoxyribodipyrimidine photolyase-related protein